MKMLSSFTHPHVVLNLYVFMGQNTMEVNGVHQLQNILQNMFFCVQQKKEILTGLEQLEGE